MMILPSSEFAPAVPVETVTSVPAPSAANNVATERKLLFPVVVIVKLPEILVELPLPTVMLFGSINHCPFVPPACVAPARTLPLTSSIPSDDVSTKPPRLSPSACIFPANTVSCDDHRTTVPPSEPPLTSICDVADIFTFSADGSSICVSGRES